MRRTKVLGITGGVGAGKSTVLAYLQEKYCAPVLQLDLAAHELMEPGGVCFCPLLEAFGENILGADGRIDRRKLYACTFWDAKKVRLLNGIVHPRVKDAVRAWIREKSDTAPFLVLEAALLLEDHYDEICDEIWYIHVEEEVRFRRLSASRGYSREKMRQILENQKTEEEFRAGCQFVVDNSGDILENTYEQIDKGLREHGFV